LSSPHDPHSYTSLDQGRVRHMDLELQVDFATKRIDGTAVLGLAAPASGPLDLDTRDLEILGARDEAGNDLEFDLAGADPILGSRLRVFLPDGTEKFSLEYATSPAARPCSGSNRPRPPGASIPTCSASARPSMPAA